VATLCTHCGATLKDDARFCNTCGTLIPSHPFRPKSARPVAPIGEAHEDTLAARHEQNGPHPSASSLRSPSKDEPPSWMSQLEPAAHNRNKISSRALQENRRQKKPEESAETNQPEKSQEEKSERVAEMPTLSWPSTPTFSWPPPPTPVVDKLPQESKSSDVGEMQTGAWSVSNADVPLQPKQHSPVVESLSQGVPISSSTQRPDSSERELHVKVWDQKEPANPVEPKEKLAPAQADDVEDLPTGPLVARSPDIVVQRSSTPAPTRKGQHSRIDELERQDTVRLAAQPAAPSSFNAVPQSRGGTWQQQVNSPDHTIRQPDQGPAAYARPGGQPVQERPPLASVAPVQDLKQTPPPRFDVTPKRRKRRKPFVIGLIVFLLLIVGSGAGAWIYIDHPFSQPAVTLPGHFTSSQLGLSLLYPHFWQFQNDQARSTVHFYDTNKTTQFNIVVSPANGDSTAYLHQQAGQVGLTGQKAGPDLSFAGTSWHQLQGTVQQSGATYTETVFVATHNQHFITITFLAPQVIYAQEDQQVFSQIRSTIQFLS
jgi:hypothetical protein